MKTRCKVTNTRFFCMQTSASVYRVSARSATVPAHFCRENRILECVFLFVLPVLNICITNRWRPSILNFWNESSGANLYGRGSWILIKNGTDLDISPTFEQDELCFTWLRISHWLILYSEHQMRGYASSTHRPSTHKSHASRRCPTLRRWCRTRERAHTPQTKRKSAS